MSKNNYYKIYFETNTSVIAKIWKGIKQLVILKSTAKDTQTLSQIMEQ